MKWIVFGLGFVLSLGGLIALVQGYDSVQIERGWPLVISGTTALSAGFVTIALGVVVSRLESLAVVGQTRNAISPEYAIPDHFSESDESGGEVAREPAMAFAADERPGAHESLSEDGESSASSVIGLDQKRTTRPDFSLALEALGLSLSTKAADEPHVSIGGPAPVAAAALTENSTTRPRSIFSLLPRVPTKSILSPGPWPSEPFRPSDESNTPPPLGERQAAEASRKEEHDWLEQALAGVEFDDSGSSKATLEEEVQRAAEAAIVPAQNPADPAVVGRYESGGASYVLFADGSIEAETDSGFYRFASMAELKKFIEGGT